MKLDNTRVKEYLDLKLPNVRTGITGIALVQAQDQSIFIHFFT